MTENRTGPPSRAESVIDTLRRSSRRPLRWLAGQNVFVIMGSFFGLGYLINRTRFESLSVFFYLTGGLLPFVLMLIGTGEEEAGYEHELSARDLVTGTVGMILWSVTPAGLLTQFLQIGGNIVPYIRYRGKLPNRKRYTPETGLTAPFGGEWTAVNGGVTKKSSHSWGLVSQRYAYDFLVTDEDGDTHNGDGDRLDEYYAFGEPIRAPADGTVVSTEDSLRDYPNPGSLFPEWRTYKITGNYVIIKHDDGEYSMLAHLQEDSVTVEPGDEVTHGEVIGNCGNSGNSSEPHLHYQLMDRSNFWIAAGLVPRFTDANLSRGDELREKHGFYEPLDGEGERGYVWAGDRIGVE